MTVTMITATIPTDLQILMPPCHLDDSTPYLMPQLAMTMTMTTTTKQHRKKKENNSNEDNYTEDLLSDTAIAPP